jgi:hypothetical protein
MDEDDDVVRPADQVVTGSLYDLDRPDTLEERVHRLMEQGLSPEEATAIAQDQLETARAEERNMNIDNKVAILKQRIKQEEEERKYKNKMASEASSSSIAAKLRALEQHVQESHRKITPEILQYIKDAFQSKRDNGINSKMEILDQKLDKIQNEINKLVERKIMSADDGEKILELFTTPVWEDSDYEGYNSGYDTSGGRRTRKTRRRTRKSRKTRKTRKSRKSRKSRKNKRK